MVKLKDIQEVFCLRPWNDIAIVTTGETIICAAQMGRSAKSFPKINSKESTTLEMLDSPLHRSVRLAQFQGQWHENCENCKLKEQAVNQPSFRKIGTNEDIRRCLHNLNSDGSLKTTQLQQVEFMFSNRCNAACVHCSPVASTAWYKEYLGFFGEQFGHSGGQKWQLDADGTGIEFHNAGKGAKIWQLLEDNKETITHVTLSGGEPLIMPESDKLLDFFISNGRADQVSLLYYTNLSEIDSATLDRWNQFKQIELSVSLDEIEDRYEFVRHPLSWDNLLSNLDRVQTHSVTVCYMIPNMLRMAEIDQWISSRGYESSLHFAYRAQGSRHLNVNILPIDARKELIEMNRAAGTTLNHLAVSHLEDQIMQPGDPEQCRQLIRFLDYLDGTRGRDWRTAIPDVYEFLKRHKIT